MNKNIKILRKHLKINQESFASKINISRSHFAMIENGSKNITDRVVTDICREFNVNEEWLRNGAGEMFVEPDTFSLDEYCRAKGASDTAIDIIKLYLGIPEDIRNDLEEYFVTHVLTKSRSKNEEAATTLQNNSNNNSSESFEEYKRRELEAYALELEAEAKGEILSALENQKGVS